ncbi:Choline transport protein OS=Saccharomyces cerevisiae (strain ATCC 204508 / S288c) GN=HNM1 PE=1 SV=1 [Rhizoctonia solani AG-1 IB]|uniref:Choline transport protein n=1 Tax=Thanatephorus cucumeris (strain AG1-IB / isolate 7/3/14) TaxID=1108050 RepID=A0A0B7FJ03_THACB|nr:Choline transport protein OS=Saccharomyces cerevisiae (strain ATCC 204508 / S288c) GN=HNM1 PE=1 SV=1 [Rhizoctonia solani AG-1 IB]
MLSSSMACHWAQTYGAICMSSADSTVLAPSFLKVPGIFGYAYWNSPFWFDSAEYSKWLYGAVLHDIGRFVFCPSPTHRCFLPYTRGALNMGKGEFVSDVVPICDSSSEARSSGSADGERLARMGYKSELKRNLGIGSLLGFGFSVTNSWWGASASLAASILSGGPVLMVYGLIFIALLSVCIGASLSELASAMPNSGGQYYWAGQIAPKRHAHLLAFLTGALNWAGSIFASSSVTLALSSSLVGLYALGHSEFVISPWMVFVAYQLVNLFSLVFNCIHRLLPILSTASLYVSIIAWLVTTIVVPAMSDTKQSARFVFATFINQTGWDNNVLAFIVGLVSPSWCFAALDVVTHMAEEIHQPERMIPRSIMATIAIGLVSSLTYTIAMVFSISDFEAVTGSATGVPILELYYQATRSLAGAVGLHVLFLLTGFGCLIGCHSWQARLAWSFSRDHGLPGSKWWSVINATTGLLGRVIYYLELT